MSTHNFIARDDDNAGMSLHFDEILTCVKDM